VHIEGTGINRPNRPTVRNASMCREFVSDGRAFDRPTTVRRPSDDRPNRPNIVRRCIAQPSGFGACSDGRTVRTVDSRPLYVHMSMR